MRRILCIIASAAILAVCLVSCKSKNNEKYKDSKFTGKWQSVKMVIDGEEMTDYFSIPFHVLMRIELKNDGSCIIASPITPNDARTGKWTDNGDKVTLDLDASSNFKKETQVFTLENGMLVTIDKDSKTGKMYLEKVSEFSEFDAEKFKEELQQSFGSLNLGDA